MLKTFFMNVNSVLMYIPFKKKKKKQIDIRLSLSPHPNRIDISNNSHTFSCIGRFKNEFITSIARHS